MTTAHEQNLWYMFTYIYTISCSEQHQESFIQMIIYRSPTSGFNSHCCHLWYIICHVITEDNFKYVTTSIMYTWCPINWANSEIYLHIFWIRYNYKLCEKHHFIMYILIMIYNYTHVYIVQLIDIHFVFYVVKIEYITDENCTYDRDIYKYTLQHKINNNWQYLWK